MSTLFSYCIPFDDGAAPNPFWGVCTLAICKPIIRHKAEIGDWVVGTGSKRSPIGDISGKVMYAMRLDQMMTMEEYDRYTQLELPDKIPQMQSADLVRHYGDSIYDFSTSIPSLRPSVHTKKNRRTDLNGGNVLLSNYFFYFGNQPIALPGELRNIVHQQQGHRRLPHRLAAFVDWIHRLGYQPATLLGNPQMWSQPNFQKACAACATGRLQEAEADLEVPDVPCSDS